MEKTDNGGELDFEMVSDAAEKYAVLGSECREYSKDFTMPDYIPAIRRVISSSVRASSASTGRDAERESWECTLTFTALILCADDTVRSIVLQDRQNGEIRLSPGAGEVWLETETENAVMRATDPRRLCGRCRLCVKACGPVAVPVEPEIAPGESGAPQGIETLDAVREYAVIRRTDITDLRSSADLELSPNDPEISDIILCDVIPYVTSVSADGEDSRLEGEAAVTVIYSDPAGDHHTLCERVPISAQVSLPESKTAFACARVDEIKASAETNAYGEQKLVELDFSWDVAVYTAIAKECVTVTDIYSTENELNVFSGSVRFDRVVGTLNQQLNVKGDATLEELGLSASDAIEAYCCSSEIGEVRRGENGAAVLNGSVTVRFVCAREGDGDRRTCAEMKLPFSCPCGGFPSSDQFEYRACSAVTNVRVKQESGRVSADAGVRVSAIVWEEYPADLVTGAEIAAPLEKNAVSMTIYYPAPDDTLWGISKKYHVPANGILDKNGVTEDTIHSKKALLIPGAK